MEIKTCLICDHCTLDLGDAGYSEMTPGYPGSMRCNLNLFKDNTGDLVNLSRYVEIGSECHAFKLHKSIQIKELTRRNL